MRSIIGLWETRTGEIIGAAHPEEPGDAWIELKPGWQELEPAILDWCQQRLATRDASGGWNLRLYIDDTNVERQRLLSGRGYEMQPDGGWQRWLRFSEARPATPVELRHPYRIRTTEPSDEDCARMAVLLNAAFGRTGHTQGEYRTFIHESPSFEEALNLVAVAADETFAAHVGITYDAVNRHGIIEPVCTAPNHQRQGLASALLDAGIRHLATRGARSAALDSGDDPAVNAFYAAAGFTEAHHGHWWRARSPNPEGQHGPARPGGRS